MAWFLLFPQTKKKSNSIKNFPIKITLPETFNMLNQIHIMLWNRQTCVISSSESNNIQYNLVSLWKLPTCDLYYGYFKSMDASPLCHASKITIQSTIQSTHVRNVSKKRRLTFRDPFFAILIFQLRFSACETKISSPQVSKLMKLLWKNRPDTSFTSLKKMKCA